MKTYSIRVIGKIDVIAEVQAESLSAAYAKGFDAVDNVRLHAEIDDPAIKERLGDPKVYVDDFYDLEEYDDYDADEDGEDEEEA